MSVTIPPTTTRVSQYTGDGALYLAVYLATTYDIVTPGGYIIPHGDPHINNSFVLKEACTVDVDGDVTTPEIVLEPTENSTDPYATYFAFFLDSLNRPIQMFLQPFRVPYIWSTRTWLQLMTGTAITQTLIDPTHSRTAGVLQMWDATYGLTDSNVRKVGTNAQVTGSLSTSTSLAVGTSATIGSTLGVTGAASFASTVVGAGSVTGNFLFSTLDTTVGRDLFVTDDGTFGGDVNAASFSGDGSGLTNLPTGVITPSTLSSTGSIGLSADTDADDVGQITFATRNITRQTIFNNGFTEFHFGAQGALWDKGGEKFNVKAYGAKGDGVDGVGTYII